MNLPAPVQVVQVEATEDHTARIADLERALKKLRWRKREGDEHLAERIEQEIASLKDG